MPMAPRPIGHCNRGRLPIRRPAHITACMAGPYLQRTANVLCGTCEFDWRQNTMLRPVLAGIRVAISVVRSRLIARTTALAAISLLQGFGQVRPQLARRARRPGHREHVQGPVELREREFPVRYVTPGDHDLADRGPCLKSLMRHFRRRLVPDERVERRHDRRRGFRVPAEPPGVGGEAADARSGEWRGPG